MPIPLGAYPPNMGLGDAWFFGAVLDQCRLQLRPAKVRNSVWGIVAVSIVSSQSAVFNSTSIRYHSPRSAMPSNRPGSRPKDSSARTQRPHRVWRATTASTIAKVNAFFVWKVWRGRGAGHRPNRQQRSFRSKRPGRPDSHFRQHSGTPDVQARRGSAARLRRALGGQPTHARERCRGCGSETG